MGQSFLYGAAVLFAASLFNRLLGFFYQITVIRLIHAEGIGLFNMMYPIYVLILVVASFGIPVAISKLVAEEVARNNLPGAYRIFKLSFLFIVLNSFICTALVVTGVPFLVEHVFPNPKVYLCFVSLIPGVLISSTCSAFRGFFQGLQQMTPTALTQALEQLTRILTGLLLAYLFLPRGIEYAAMGISIGVVCGEFIGLVAMISIYFRKRPLLPLGVKSKYQESCTKSIGRIFEMSFPVTLTRFITTGLMSIDAIVIPQRLQVAGLTMTEATSVYGQFIGIAESLLLAPSIITASLATALIPAISDASAQGKYLLLHGRIADAVRLTILTGFPCTVIFFVFSEELCGLLFGYAEAGIMLQILAISGPFLYFYQMSTGILQGLGRPERPFKNLVLGSVFKVFGLYYLTSIPQLGIKGTSLAFVVSCIMWGIFNYHDLVKLTGFKIPFLKFVIKPAFAACCMGLIVVKIEDFILMITGLKVISTTCALVCGGILYACFLIIFKCIETEDINRFKELLKY